VKTVILLLLALSVSHAYADNLECMGCVHMENIRGQAVTTEKIRKEAVTEGKMSPEVRQKLNGLVVTDGVGRQLPIELSYVTSAAARGYFHLENGSIMPISIGRRDNQQPYQVYGSSLDVEVIGNLIRLVSHVLYTGAGCTGVPYIASFSEFEPQYLFPFIVVPDFTAPNRSRLIFKIGARINEELLPLSYSHDFDGCVEADPDHPLPNLPYLSANDIARVDINNYHDPIFMAVSLDGGFRWVPPLTISAPN
jgi:hypothetical protein